MKLRKGISLAGLWTAIRACRGQVYFVTEHGDRLNLKSPISQTIFVSQFASQSDTGSVECSEEDAKNLSDFCE